MTTLPFGLTAWNLISLIILVGGFVMSTKRTTSANQQAIDRQSEKLDEIKEVINGLASKTEDHEVRITRLEEWRKYRERE